MLHDLYWADAHTRSPGISQLRWSQLIRLDGPLPSSSLHPLRASVGRVHSIPSISHWWTTFPSWARVRGVSHEILRFPIIVSQLRGSWETWRAHWPPRRPSVLWKLWPCGWKLPLDPDVCRSKCAVTSMAAQGSKPSGSSDTLCCRAAETWLAARYTDLNLHGLANVLRGHSV